MSTHFPYLGPCSSVNDGYRDSAKYEKLKLPKEWSASRLNSLGAWISPDEYFWTPDSFFEVMSTMTPELLQEIRAKSGGCFFHLSLSQQCTLMGIKYQKIHPLDMIRQCTTLPLSAADPVEKFAFDFYRTQGWSGDRGEGASIHLLSEFLNRQLVLKGVKFHGRYYRSLDEGRYPHYIFKRNGIDEGEEKIFSEEVETILKHPSLITTYQTWQRQPRHFALPRTVAPALFPVENFFSVCEGLTQNALIDITRLHVRGYGGMGWPDLTLQKNGELVFVEVKQAQDKFTHRQAYWIRNFAVPLGLDFTVLHVTPSIKVGLRSRAQHG